MYNNTLRFSKRWSIKMSYGGWSLFFAENSTQMAVVAGATLFGVPFSGRSMTSALMNGAAVGVATDLAFGGVRNLDAKRALVQGGVGAGTALATIVVASAVL